MQFFHLEQPYDELILCDRTDCDAIADYLEIEDDGTEHRRCSFHTRSERYASRLAARLPNRAPAYGSKPSSHRDSGA
jgi:hypothetical protein